MNRRFLIAVLVVAAVIALPVAWYLLSPLFITRQIEEAFPTELPAPSVEFDVVAATEAMEEAMAEPTMMVEEPMPTAEPATMTVLAQGEFYNIVHEGRGQVTVHQLADGSRFLRLEDFEVLNGPELHVYLAPIDPVPETIGVEIEGAVDLGLLKGNVGSQNYDLPAELDLAQYKSVVIWCQPVRVPVIAAPLSADFAAAPLAE